MNKDLAVIDALVADGVIPYLLHGKVPTEEYLDGSVDAEAVIHRLAGVRATDPVRVAQKEENQRHESLLKMAPLQYYADVRAPYRTRGDGQFDV